MKELQGGGFVDLLDHMGSDLTVVNAARVSFEKQSYWEYNEDGTVHLKEEDIKLIRYLAKEGHWTPFSHCILQFRIRMPIVIARQYFKSTVGLTRNEVSRRYVTSEPEFMIPKEWRLSSPRIKQGSLDEIHEDSELLTEMVEQTCKMTARIYDTLLSKGVCAEQARMVLSQNMFTEFIETGSLYAYARIYGLRCSGTHAQKETQEYAEVLSDIIKIYFPVSWDYLTNSHRE